MKGGFNLKSGKLSTDKLRNNILDNIKVKRPEVLVHSGIGEDSSIIGFGKHCCVLSSDPITGSGSNIGRLAVHINCNDIAASGVEPLGILVTILAPESCSEQDIFGLMDEINETAAGLNIEVLGGHTEVTSAVNRMIVSVTAVGKGSSDGYTASSGARDGDCIIVTKSVGLEGTSILAGDHEDYLKDKLSIEAIKTAKSYINNISVVKEGIICGKLGANAMHDATEGGLLGAVWEIAEASNKGFELYEGSIPVTNVTREICDIFGINPLRLISSGMMVITTDKCEVLLEALHQNGIEATCIGRMTADESCRVMESIGVRKPIEPPDVDELFNIKIR
jgi:Hydrogenase maturation factor